MQERFLNQSRTQFNKRIALGNGYRNKAFAIEKQYGIKSTTYQDDLDRQEEIRRKKNLKEYQDNLKKTEKLMSEMRKRAALSMNQGTTPIPDSFEQDIKNAEKDVQDNLAFQLKNIKENSAISLNIIKERYQTEVSEAQGIYELIKKSQENMIKGLANTTNQNTNVLTWNDLNGNSTGAYISKAKLN